MPNGVICGGAVDGSNQAGEIVTCQAMTTRPAGAGAPAFDGLAPNSRMAVKSDPSARFGRPRHEIIGASSHFPSHSTPTSGLRPGSGALGEPADQKLDQRGDFWRSGSTGWYYDIERDRGRGPVAHDRFETARPKVAPNDEFRLNGHAQTGAKRRHQCIGVVGAQWSAHRDLVLFARRADELP